MQDHYSCELAQEVEQGYRYIAEFCMEERIWLCLYAHLIHKLLRNAG